MASVVSIQIRVDDGNSAATVAKVEQSLKSLGVTASTTNQAVNTVGSGSGGSAPPALRWAQQAAEQTRSFGPPAIRWMQQMSQEGGHVTSSLDNIRLAAQSLGVRLPRALENAFSRMPMIASGLAGIGSGLIALGSIEVLVHLGMEAYDLYNQFFDVNKQLRDFQEHAGAAANTKLFDVASLETSTDLLAEANRQITELEAKRKEAGADKPGGGFMQYFHQYASYLGAAGVTNPSDIGATTRAAQNAPIFDQHSAEALAQAYGNRDLSQMHRNDLGRQYGLEGLRNSDSAAASSLKGYNQAARQLQNALDESKMIQDNALASERDLQKTTADMRAAELSTPGYDKSKLTPIHVIDSTAGSQERQLAEQKAREDFSAKMIELSRQERDAQIAAQNDAINSGLDGEAKYSAMRLEAIEALTRKYQDGELSMAGYRAIRASTEEKFDNEAQQRMEQQIETAKKALQSAEAGGMTGAARIISEHNARINDINTDRTLDPVAASIQRQAAQRQADNEMSQLDRDFTDRAKGFVDERTEYQLNAFDRIDAAAQKQRDESERRFKESFISPDGTNNATDAQKGQHTQELQAIDASAAAQRRQLAQKNAADDLQYDREAAQAELRVRQEGIMGWVNSYKDGIAEIRAQEEQRIAKLEEDAQREGLTWEEVSRREGDIVRAANADMAEQNANLQHQIAGQLQSAFSDPTAYIKQKMEQMFFEVIASWIMRTETFKRYFGGALGGMQPGSAGSSTGVGGLLGGILGGHRAPTGTAGVISGGATLPPSWTGTSMIGQPASGASAGPGGMSPIAGMGGVDRSSTYSPASTIGGINDVLRTASQIAGGRTGGFNPYAGLPGTDEDWGGTPGMGPSLSDVTSAMYPGGGPGAMQSIGGAPGLSASLNGAAGLVAGGLGVYTGIKGVISDFGKSGLNGALSSTISGATAGAAIGSIIPGFGTAIGAAVGAALGLGTNLVGDILGMGGKDAARDYYNNTLLKQLGGIDISYSSGGGGDFLSAISQVNQAASQGYAYMAQKWGTDAATWVKDNYLDKEANKVIGDITALAGGGHQYTQRAALQFHGGGAIRGFGDLATSSSEGFVHAKLGEHVIMPEPASTHAPFLSAINGGASAQQMAAMYLQASGSGSTRGGSSSGGDTHLHIHTMDPKNMSHWLKHGGGVGQIRRALNSDTQRYGGDALNV